MKRWRTLANGSIAVEGEGLPVLPDHAPSGPSGATIRSVRARWFDPVARNAARTGIPIAWLLAIVAAESAGDPNARSPAGALGLAQLMPINWRGKSEAQIRDPEVNLAIASEMLRTIADRNAFELPRIASVYNAGGGTGNVPWPRADRPWGMAEDPPYIDWVVRGSNTAIAQLSGTDAPAPEQGKGIPLPVIVLLGKLLIDELGGGR